MVLTGLPADGKASFCIALHCGFRYCKRRFYRILMLFQIAIDAWSGLRKSHSLPEYVPPYSKNRIPDAQSQSTHARGHQSGVPSRNTYPRIRKNRKNRSRSLLFMNGGRAKTTTNHTHQRKQPIYSIGTASKYCATPVAFAEPADSPDCIAPSKISAAAANSTVSSIKSPLFGANSLFAKP